MNEIEINAGSNTREFISNAEEKIMGGDQIHPPLNGIITENMHLFSMLGAALTIVSHFS